MAFPLILIATRVQMNFGPLYKAYDKGKRVALTDSIKIVAKEAKKTIRKRKGPSEPGNPPHGKSGNLRRSIRWKVGKSVAWAGSTWPKGPHGQLMKWGAPGANLLPRPFMLPALAAARNRIPKKWGGIL